jgi:hypothetical protein
MRPLNGSQRVNIGIQNLLVIKMGVNVDLDDFPAGAGESRYNNPPSWAPV